MKRYLKIMLLLTGFFIINHSATAQYITGKVLSESTNLPIDRVSISTTESKSVVLTDKDGMFTISLQNGATLTAKYIGYIDFKIEVKPENATQILVIRLKPSVQQLSEVTVVSTGYQKVPKERVTGSFDQIDNKLLNRRISTDILSRLEDVVPGLVFNREPGATSNSINIRGQSTINANSQPLIVLDNFPYDGDLRNINPNDIENITILKDAAAASIWGARAGNGVIVLTTKKGKLNQPLQITFNSNITFSEKPDLFYLRTMSSADYIETEKRLFSEGYYRSAETSVTKTPLTPVIELLIAKRDGLMLGAEADQKIDQLKENDVREDYNTIIQRKGVNQQHSLNLGGGSSLHRYSVSAGFDKNLSNLRGNDFNRTTLNLNNSFSLLKNKLEMQSNVYIVQNKSNNNNFGTNGLGIQGRLLYPYGKLMDDSGNSLPVPRNYRTAYINDISNRNLGLLDWEYRPVDEIMVADNQTRSSDYLINTSVKYNIITGLSAELLHQYGRTSTVNENTQSINNYYVRNLINEFTIIKTDGSIERPVPLGGILDFSNLSSIRNNLRGQISFTRAIQDKHEINAIGGFEIRDLNTITNSYRLYGYDPYHATSKSVNYAGTFASFVYPQSINNLIPNRDSRQDLTDRFLSYYGNASYTFDKRIIISASARIDKSNLFGVNANQKGVSLWSLGGSWDVAKEKFYSVDWLPYLRIRATYGFSGNIDKSLSAYTTALYYSGNDLVIRQPYASILNPPNPELRWEKIAILNFGVDFSLKDNVLSGSIEYYNKRGIDLIGEAAFPHYTGISSFRGNNADIKIKGFDLNLSSRNLNKTITWTTNYLFSYASDKVTDYKVSASTNSYMSFLSTPLVGKPLYAIYSYRWAGLDPTNGNPQGYLSNNSVSSDYTAIIGQTSTESMVFNGRARPLIFGAIRNTLAWKNLELSFNISYRLGYYFRKYSIQYNDNYGLGGHGDYYLRWQKLGDENNTNVPSIPVIPNSNRDNFYLKSEVLVEKGDHIRLQDVNLSYYLSKQTIKNLPIKGLQFYTYINNLGLIWKANKSGIDPDYQNGMLPRTIAAGVKIDF